MKKIRTITVLALAITMCFSIAACGSKDNIKTDDDILETQDQSTGDATEGPNTSEAVHFKGVIDSIDGNEAIVTPDEGEDIRSSGDAVVVYIADYSKSLKVGDSVTIYYDGTVMESYPLQINVLGINDEMFEIEEPADCDNLDEAVSFENPDAPDTEE